MQELLVGWVIGIMTAGAVMYLWAAVLDWHRRG
jgi:hypothetical protein